MTRVEQLVVAMTHATDTDEVAIAELRCLAGGDNRRSSRPPRTYLAQPASLAARSRAIELLSHIRYEDPAAY